MLFAGAAYMAWIGLTLIRSAIEVGAVGGASTTRSAAVPPSAPGGGDLPHQSQGLSLRGGGLSGNSSSPSTAPSVPQALVTGMMTVAMQLCIYGGLALAAGRSRDLLVSNPRATRSIGRAAGVLFVVVAALTAWHGWRG